MLQGHEPPVKSPNKGRTPHDDLSTSIRAEFTGMLRADHAEVDFLVSPEPVHGHSIEDEDRVQLSEDNAMTRVLTCLRVDTKHLSSR